MVVRWTLSFALLVALLAPSGMAGPRMASKMMLLDPVFLPVFAVVQSNA